MHIKGEGGKCTVILVSAKERLKLSTSTCCQDSGLYWFCKELDASTGGGIATPGHKEKLLHDSVAGLNET